MSRKLNTIHGGIKYLHYVKYWNTIGLLLEGMGS